MMKKLNVMLAMTEPFSALAFKIMTDPYVGKLTFFRVYSGVLQSGSYVQNSTKGKRERVGRILQMHANSVKKFLKYTLEILQQQLVLKILQLVILYVMRKTLLFLNLWNSLNQLSLFLLNQNQKLTKIKWV